MWWQWVEKLPRASCPVCKLLLSSTTRQRSSSQVRLLVLETFTALAQSVIILYYKKKCCLTKTDMVAHKSTFCNHTATIQINAAIKGCICYSPTLHPRGQSPQLGCLQQEGCHPSDGKSCTIQFWRALVNTETSPGLGRARPWLCGPHERRPFLHCNQFMQNTLDFNALQLLLVYLIHFNWHQQG